MGLNELVQFSVADTRGSLWPWFAPEIILSATLIVMLMMRVIRIASWIDSALWAFLGAGAALYMTVMQGATRSGEIFTGMLVVDPFSTYVRAVLFAFLLLFVVFTRISGIPSRRDAADFYTLIFGSVIGMCLMISANHLLVVFLAVEMASVPSYVLAATIKGNRTASEGALKYAIYGAGAAGIMLYGISLLSGLTNSAHLPTIAMNLTELYPKMLGPEKMVLALAGLMIGVGLAFKLSAFPFHFWCPDVFEGSSAEVDAFLSIASKGAALALLVRVCLGLGTISTRDVSPPDATGVAPVMSVLAMPESAMPESAMPESAMPESMSTAGNVAGSMSRAPATTPVAFTEAAESASPAKEADTAMLRPIRDFMALFVAFIAAITCTFGNLAAYGQTNIKRMLAYSTIAHAGYMLLPVPAALALVGVDDLAAGRAIGSIGFYLAIYLFMNLAAFAMVAFLRNELKSEQIADYAGLVQQSPMLVVCAGLIFFSLVGIPPLAGFAGKFAIFSAVAEGYTITRQPYLFILLLIGGLNTAISLFYYLRVVKVMAIDPPPDLPRPFRWSMISLGGAYLVAVSVPLILLFLGWNQLLGLAQAAAQQLF